jgi:glutamate formiminotransferase/formiminotetrahydrofolate cyclodeaminase
MPLVECVPNFSEGRRPEVVDAICAAMTAVPGVALLDREMDRDHHRAVVTLAGEGTAVAEAAFRGIARAAELIDLRTHQGEHPRMGDTDVVPFIPLGATTMDDCVRLAGQLGERVGRELGIPVFLSESAARRPERRNLADVRKGQYEKLRELIGTDPARDPDFGPRRIHDRAGATAIGARFFLIAYNVNLATPDVAVAKQIASLVREKDGGLRAVKAMGFALAERGLAQVSMNLVDYRETSPAQAFAAIARHAAERGIAIAESELVGLIPAAALEASAVQALKIANFRPDQVIEARLAAARALGDLSIPEFVERLASSTATPGGGSAAALAGALAAALAAMVVRLTEGKPKLAAAAARLTPLLPELDGLAMTLRGAITRDATAYDAVMAALRLPKVTDAEKAARTAAIQSATAAAAAVPLEVATAATRVAGLAVAVAEHGNPNALTDAASAASLAQSAVECAGWNVLVNVGGLADKVEAGRLRSEVERLRTAVKASADAVRARVATALA